ncbi:MAG: carboxypeptidase-like regulatory domain-containing protein [Candidatus Saccharimonadales bacterium]
MPHAKKKPDSTSEDSQSNVAADDTVTDKTVDDTSIEQPTDTIADDATTEATHETVADRKVNEKNAETMKLNAIESMEVSAEDGDEVSVDPDQEVTIIPDVVRTAHTPWWKHRVAKITGFVLVVVIVLLAIPMTRYMMLGWIWQRDVTVTVQDTATGNAVAAAEVTIGDQTATTNNEGQATLRSVPLGVYTMTIQKKYYGEEQQTIAVDVLPVGETTATLRANGTIVRVAVVDALTDMAVRDASVASSDSKFGKTSQKGEIEVLIPTGKKELEITTTSSQHNVQKTAVTRQTKTVRIVPTGSVYFLNKQDGRIAVVKTNYDGSALKVVVPGTGDESDESTALIASTDWRYMALRAKRAPNKPESLYVVSTKDDSYVVMDDASATFVPVGWIGHLFVYQSTVLGNDQWRGGSTVLKSYNAETGKTIVLDSNASDPASTAVAALYETIESPVIAGGLVVYGKVWATHGEKTISTDGKQAKIVTIKADGSDQKVVKSDTAATVEALTLHSGAPSVVYVTIGQKQGSNTFGEITTGVYKDITDSTLATREYPAYVVSPDGTKTLWTEQQGDASTLYLGDKAAGNRQAVAVKDMALQPYAWLSDDRVILQKDNAELVIMTVDRLKKGATPLTVGAYLRTTPIYIAGYGVR